MVSALCMIGGLPGLRALRIKEKKKVFFQKPKMECKQCTNINKPDWLSVTFNLLKSNLKTKLKTNQSRDFP